MISLPLAISILHISLITSFSCVFASRFSRVPAVLCRAGRDAEGAGWVGGKLMRRDQEWAAIPAKAFPWQFMFWKMWVLGNLHLFLPIHCSIMEEDLFQRCFASATAQGAALGWKILALLQVGDRNESKWWEALGFPPFALIVST